MSELTWVEDGELLEDAGDLGGDSQAGSSYDRRFVFGPVEGRYMVITVAAWAAYADPHADEPGPPYCWESYDQFTICTDLADVGGSEVSSDYVYTEGSALTYDTLEAAEAGARREVASSRLGPQEYDPTEELRAGVFTFR